MRLEIAVPIELEAAFGRLYPDGETAEAAGGPASVREVLEILVLGGLPPNAPEGDEASHSRTAGP